MRPPRGPRTSTFAWVSGERAEARRQGGLYVPVDVERLIERVYVAPHAPEWFGELVRSVAELYGFHVARIGPSDLARDPIY